MVTQDPQFMAEIVRSGLSSLLYLGVSVFFALNLAQRKPIITIEGSVSNHKTEGKTETSKLDEKTAEKIEKKLASK